MAKFRPLQQNMDVRKTFATEDGTHYRHWKQDFDPAIRHVEHLRHKVNQAPKVGNRSGWSHVGSIPITLLQDWLTRNGYTMDQWARNEGGHPYSNVNTYKHDNGVKSQFLKFFLDRDFSKLHNQHVTTKNERSSVQVPAGLKRQAADIELGVPNGVPDVSRP